MGIIQESERHRLGAIPDCFQQRLNRLQHLCVKRGNISHLDIGVHPRDQYLEPRNQGNAILERPACDLQFNAAFQDEAMVAH